MIAQSNSPLPASTVWSWLVAALSSRVGAFSARPHASRLAGIGESFLGARDGRRFQASRSLIKVSRDCSCSGTSKGKLANAPPALLSSRTLFIAPGTCLYDVLFPLLLTTSPASGLRTRLVSLWRHGPVVRLTNNTNTSSFWGRHFLTFASHLHVARCGRKAAAVRLRDFPSSLRYPIQSAYLPFLIALAGDHVFPVAASLGGALQRRRCR